MIGFIELIDQFVENYILIFSILIHEHGMSTY